MTKHLLLNSAGALLMVVLGVTLPVSSSQAQFTGSGSERGQTGGTGGSPSSDSDMRSSTPGSPSSSDWGSTGTQESTDRPAGAMGPIRNDTEEETGRSDSERRMQRQRQDQYNNRSTPGSSNQQPGSGPNGQVIPGQDTGTETP